jgi:pimeloyl-ACP methyl ester carboxylesterase
MRLLADSLESGYATSFDGTPIFWERHGPALDDPQALRPMIFCYGLVCSMNQWRQQVARYSSRGHPCVLLDYRAHHRSGNPSDPSLVNISVLAKDVSCVIHHLKIRQPVHVWGHSMGCNVALELALAEPELCRSLVLCCGTPDSPFNQMLGSQIPAMLSKKLFGFMKGYPEPVHRVWDMFRSKPALTHISAYLAGFNTDASTRDDIQAYAEAVCEVASETFFALLEDMSRGETRAILPRVRVPCLVVAGARDRVTPPSEQRALAELLPDSEYVEIPAGSHNVQLDFGEYVSLKVEEYWRKRDLI